MQILKTHYHPEVKPLENKSIFTRLATRGIAIQDDMILLLYTKRYEDYSLPGGGLDSDEDKVEGMMRELSEETGAKDIRNIKPFGKIKKAIIPLNNCRDFISKPKSYIPIRIIKCFLKSFFKSDIIH